MKLLILLLIVACGHKEPPAKDVGDSDGDHILNYQENELDKYVAETVPFGEVKATLSFQIDTKLVQIELTNNSNQALNALKLLTKSSSLLKLEDYFSEWSALRPTTPFTEKLVELQYPVTLTLETQEKPALLVLSDGKAVTPVQKFAKRIDFNLYAEELGKILSGKSRLELRRSAELNTVSSEDSVHERTYRVFLFDGRVGKVHYVSREIEFEKYILLMGLEAQDIMALKGFSSTDEKDKWWSRSLGDDKVLVYSNLKHLAKFQKSGFNKVEQTITRSNGKQGSVLQVTKAPDTKYVLKFRGTRTVNFFREFRKNWHQGGARGEISEDCFSLNREVNLTTGLPFSRDNFSEMVLTSKEKVRTLKELMISINESSDDQGHYYELVLDKTPETFTISLPTRPAGTFQMTGAYYVDCIDIKRGGTPTNEEGQMTINVESFIEKID